MNNTTIKTTQQCVEKPVAGFEHRTGATGKKPSQALHTSVHNLHRMETIAEHFTVAGSPSPNPGPAYQSLVVLAEH